MGYICVLTLVIVIGIAAQASLPPLPIESVELITPWIKDANGKTIGLDRQRRQLSCLDLVRLKPGCGVVSLDFGTRVGVNQDLFKINGGKADLTRMLRIGKYDWTDKFMVPYVESWSQLGPGETRHISINASGGDGADGADGLPGIAGMNGDGTYTPIVIPRNLPAQSQARSKTPKTKNYAAADVTEQVSSKVISKKGKSRADQYNPLVEIKKGYMYVVRVIDDGDHYILIRVDDVVTGERVKISFLKLDLGVVL